MNPPFVPFPEPRLFATFVRREKRFLAHMLLADGTAAIAHCPNTGSMRGNLEPGAPTVLWDSQNPARKYRLGWKAIRAGGVWIGVDTGLPNRLAALAIGAGTIPPLAGYAALRAEHRLSPATRIDLFLEDPRKGTVLVEVKNVTLVEGGTARFPDAVTARGLKHLEELAREVAAGRRVAMVYVVQRGDGERFAPADDIDPAYGRALREAARQGVEVYALGARVSPEGVAATGLLPLLL